MKQQLYFPYNYGRTILKKFFFLTVTCIVSFILCIQTAGAQCTIFHNADSANPILKASPAPPSVAGLKFIDIDGDGDLDCYVATGSRLLLYRNWGTPVQPRYILSSTTGFENDTLSYYALNGTFAFADLDGDGDYDFVEPDFVPYVNHGGGVNFLQTFENTGTAQHPAFVKGGANPESVASDNPYYGYNDISFADIDGDGRQDLYVSEHSFPGLLNKYYLNTSNTAAPVYTYYQTYGSFFNYFYSSFYDFTGDGLPDLIQNDGNSYFQFQPNLGTVGAPAYYFPYYGAHPDFAGIAPYVLVDLNGDGAVEEFNKSGHYGTLAPVAAIHETTQRTGNRTLTKLAASYTDPSYTYKWQYNGKLIPGYGKPYLYALKKGEYTLYVTDTCGTGVSLTYTNADTSHTQNRESNSLIAAGSVPDQSITVKSYPNPFTQAVSIQLPQEDATVKSTLRITDMAGRVMLIQTTSAASVTVGSSLPKGAYLLQVWQQGECIYHNTLLKQ